MGGLYWKASGGGPLIGGFEWGPLVGGLWWGLLREASGRSLCSGPLVWGLWRGALMSGFWWDSSGGRPLGGRPQLEVSNGRPLMRGFWWESSYERPLVGGNW